MLIVKPRLRIILFIIIIFGLVAAGCGPQNPGQSYQLAALDELPDGVQSAPVSVQQAYQFALSNPEILKEIPCYCGCGGMGHTSNYSCYIAEDNPGQDIEFDGHALGCSICVDITQDTMQMLDQGKSLSEIQGEIDNIYSAFGPSNMP
jgi:hypothetical protein